MLWIDSVRLQVLDLDVAAADLAVTAGLGVATADAQARRATIVPVGPAFLELVIDDDAPRWSVATDDFDRARERLGLPATSVTWRYADGATARCRMIRADDRRLPAIVDWCAGRHPSGSPAGHRREPLGISCVVIGGDPEALRAWLGADVTDLPIQHLDGGAAVESVHIALADARVILPGSRRHEDEYAV